jgi:hypothetical protein
VLPRLPFLWCYGVFRCSISLRVILVFKDIIYAIIILYICDIWLLWTLLAVCVEQLILGHAYDQYLVLAYKPSMTEVVPELCQPYER